MGLFALQWSQGSQAAVLILDQSDRIYVQMQMLKILHMQAHMLLLCLPISV